MDRASVAALMGLRLSGLLGQAGMTSADEPGNMKEPIDDALRGLGYAEADLATADHEDVPGFIAATRYFTLKAILERVSASFDLTDEGSSIRLSQVVDHVRKLMNEAWEDASQYISGGGDPIIDLDLNFLTPRVVSEFG